MEQSVYFGDAGLCKIDTSCYPVFQCPPHACCRRTSLEAAICSNECRCNLSMSHTSTHGVVLRSLTLMALSKSNQQTHPIYLIVLENKLTSVSWRSPSPRSSSYTHPHCSFQTHSPALICSHHRRRSELHACTLIPHLSPIFALPCSSFVDEGRLRAGVLVCNVYLESTDNLG